MSMRMSLRFVAALSAGIVGLGASAHPTPECRIKVLRPVADDNGRQWAAGATAPATFIRRDAGGDFYCEDHGQCLPHMVRGVEVTKPIDCRPGKAASASTIWLDPDPRAMGAHAARQVLARRRAEQQLSALGFDNASAGGLAEAYASRPASPDGRLVARVLAGSRPALATLRKREQPR